MRRPASTKARRRVGGARQAGVALAVVLWFVAGMALLVSGIVSRGRVDVQLAQVHRFRAEAASAGDGAVRLMLADMLDRQSSGAGDWSLPTGVYRVGRQEVEVVAVPGLALIDLNRASLQALTALFRHTLAVPPPEARSLAAAVIQWRDSGEARRLSANGRSFSVLEDLLRVEGMTRTRLDALRDYVTVWPEANGQRELGRGGAGLLPWLDDQRPVSAVRAQEPLPRRIDGARPPVQARFFRVDALLSLGGRQWLRRHWVELTGSGRRDSALPWHELRVETPRVAALP